MSVKLIVKGTIDDVVSEAQKRGFKLSDLSRFQAHSSNGTCTLSVDEGRMADVIDWFCEPGEAPYPVGTLLHYQLASPKKE